MIKTTQHNSNYSVFLLLLLFTEFVSYFFRANNLSNLGIVFRMVVFGYIVGNFFICLLLDIGRTGKISKINLYAILFMSHMLAIYVITNRGFVLLDVINMIMSVAVFYLFNYFGFPKSIKRIEFLIGTFVVIFAFLYYKYALNNGFVGNKPGVVNAIYYLVMSMPFVFLMNNKVLKIVLLSIISILTVLSNKTTAIVMVLVSMFVFFVFSKKKKNSNILMIFGGVLAFVLFTYFIVEFTEVNILGIVSSDVEGGNGRLEIWTEALNEFQNGEFFQKLFGFGFNYVSGSIGYSAHCDFIEILSSFGLVGLALFLLWFVVLGKFLLNAMKGKKNHVITVTIFYQMLLILLFSSTIFISNYFLILIALSGMLINEYTKERLSEEYKE